MKLGQYDKEEWQEGVGGAKGSFAAEQVLSEVLETAGSAPPGSWFEMQIPQLPA